MKFQQAIIITAALSLVPASALAHAHLLSAEPAENQMAMPAPQVLKLKFSEAVEPKLSTVTILGPDKKPVDGVSVAPDPKDPKVLIVTLKAALPEGKDTVNWVAVAKDDGHKTSGSYTLDAMN